MPASSGACYWWRTGGEVIQWFTRRVRAGGSASACASRYLRAASTTAPRQRHAARCRLWPDEATTLQALGQEQQTLAIEPQHLEDVAATTTEHKHVAAEWIGLQHGLRQCGQAVEALPHVGVPATIHTRCSKAGRSCAQGFDHHAQSARVNAVIHAHRGAGEFNLDRHRDR